MKKEKIDIFVGKEKIGEKASEVYQLRADGVPLFQASYNGSISRDEFYKDLTHTIIELITPGSAPLEIFITNGLKINPLKWCYERIPELEYQYVNQLDERIKYGLASKRFSLITTSQN